MLTVVMACIIGFIVTSVLIFIFFRLVGLLSILAQISVASNSDVLRSCLTVIIAVIVFCVTSYVIGIWIVGAIG